MNYLIQKIAESGLSSAMYGWINALGLVIAFLYSLWHGKKLGVPLWKMVIILVGVHFGVGYIGNGVWSLVQHIRDIHFLGIETATNSIVRLFIFYPLIALSVALMLRLKCSLACDAIVMFPLLRSCIGQLACLFPGCCRGLQWQGGIYNVQTGMHHFPTPIFETVLTAIIFAYLVYRTRRNLYVSDGTLYPLMMVLYGVMRFYCELLRENEKIFFGCSALGLHALIVCVIGAVWLFICYRKKEIDNEESIQTYEVEDNQVKEGVE